MGITLLTVLNVLLIGIGIFGINASHHESDDESHWRLAVILFLMFVALCSLMIWFNTDRIADQVENSNSGQTHALPDSHSHFRRADRPQYQL